MLCTVCCWSSFTFADTNIIELRQAADQGDAEAEHKLGTLFYTGVGMPKDGVKALQWWQKAAEQGNAAAEYDLGLAYYNGEGVIKDDTEAAQWFRKAAEHGNAYAQAHLGLAYYNGNGVTKDDNEAAMWYRKAADQGIPSAEYNLGLAYYNGEGVAKDEVEAIRWFSKAADQGNAYAQANLGLAYYNGTGVLRDVSVAVWWWRKAARQGVDMAQNNLGVAYRDGTGVSVDPVEAVRWWRKAAEQGDATAEYNLSMAYRDGIGVPKDAVEAGNLLQKAIEHGNAEAANIYKQENRQRHSSSVDMALQGFGRGFAFLVIMYMGIKTSNNRIGGWLLCFVLYIYAMLLNSMYYLSSGNDSGGYVLPGIVMALCLGLAGITSGMIKYQTWRWVKYLRMVLAAAIVCGFLPHLSSYLIDPLINTSAVPGMVILLSYFFISKRVKHVFQIHDWGTEWKNDAVSVAKDSAVSATKDSAVSIAKSVKTGGSTYLKKLKAVSVRRKL